MCMYVHVPHMAEAVLQVSLWDEQSLDVDLCHVRVSRAETARGRIHADKDRKYENEQVCLTFTNFIYSK